jgi:hypothetical protein
VDAVLDHLATGAMAIVALALYLLLLDRIAS